jgi:hypothetical protein
MPDDVRGCADYEDINYPLDLPSVPRAEVIDEFSATILEVYIRANGAGQRSRLAMQFMNHLMAAAKFA